MCVFAASCIQSHTSNAAEIPSDSVPDANTTPRDSGTSACISQSAVVESLNVQNARGVLAATLQLPASCPPSTVVLIVPGSGGTNRDRNSADGTGPAIYKRLAEALAARGIGSLRYDKAGVGDSASAFPATESDLRFEDGVQDAALWLKPLRGDARVGRIVLAGHSEGALLALLVARDFPVDGVISLAGAGRPIDVLLREQLARNPANASLLAEADTILKGLKKGEMTATVSQPLLGLFRPSVQPYLIGWLGYDPAAEAAKWKGPFAIFQGRRDIQVLLADAEALRAARPDSAYAIFDNMGHALKEEDGSRASQQRAYSDPGLPIVSALVDAVVNAAQTAR